jgi:hypothetical protein
MRGSTVFVASALVVFFACAVIAAPAILPDSTEAAFEEWAAANGKNYATSEERDMRFTIFSQSFERVRSHNAKYDSGQKSFFLALNRFSDMTFQEKSVVFGAKRPSQPLADLSLPPPPPLSSIPDTVDWRSNGKVRPLQLPAIPFCNNLNMYPPSRTRASAAAAGLFLPSERWRACRQSQTTSRGLKLAKTSATVNQKSLIARLIASAAKADGPAAPTISL